MTIDLNLDTTLAQYRQRAIVAFQTAFIIGAAALFVFITGSWSIELSIVVSASLSALSILLATRKKILPSALILGSQFLVLPTYLAYTGLGTFDSVMLLYPAGMMTISVVARPRMTAVFSLLTMACVALVGLATLSGWNGNKVFTNAVAENPVDIVATLVIIAFAGIVATYVSVILTEVLQTLAEHQATLEARILQRTADLAASNDELRQAVRTLDQARAELVRGEKLAGLGSLVAGVSHELNTPIGNTAVAASTLLHHVQTFRQQVDAGILRKSELQGFLESCTEGAELIASSSQRAAELVSSFKQVAVDQTSDRRREFELDDVISDVIRSIRPSFKGRDWTIESNVAGGIHCDGYPGPLGQVIANLMQNAIFHGFRDRTHGNIRIKARRLDDRLFEITVQDDGAGIPAESMQKIFDPFFTTRLGQGGSGLGLTIVQNLVHKMLGGKIDVWSEVGQGSRFTLTLPLIVLRENGAGTATAS